MYNEIKKESKEIFNLEKKDKELNTIQSIMSISMSLFIGLSIILNIFVINEVITNSEDGFVVEIFILIPFTFLIF